MSLAIGALGPAPIVRAGNTGVFTPTRFDDPPADACASNDCSLREAIRAANATPGTNLIELEAGTYQLTNAAVDDNALGGDLDITEGTTVVLGLGTGATTIDGTNTARVFHAFSGNLTLEGLTVTRGFTNLDGAGVRVEAGRTLVLSDVALTGNDATSSDGGALNLHGDATLTDVLIAGNTAGVGGGIYAAGAVNAERVTLSANKANYAGGVYISVGQTATFVNSTISGNQASSDGGGVHTAATPLTLSGVTISGNTADSDGSGSGTGGGLVYSAGTVAMKNSILAGNTDASPMTKEPDCNGPIASGGHNILGNSTSCTLAGGTGDQIGTAGAPIDPGLAPLADNGGPTPTQRLLPGSPAIGNGGDDCAATDQRGAPRKDCDVGAYELVTCGKVVVNRVGTPEGETVAGTSGPDGILGNSGKDTLKGKGGKDALCGGKGKDTLKAGGGKDFLNGEGGKDVCVGGPGRDSVRSCEQQKTI